MRKLIVAAFLPFLAAVIWCGIRLVRARAYSRNPSPKLVSQEGDVTWFSHSLRTRPDRPTGTD
jgi:hypothetical protein